MGKNNRAKKKKKPANINQRQQEIVNQFQQARIESEINAAIDRMNQQVVLRIMLADMYILCEKFRFSGQMIEKFGRWETMVGMLFYEKEENNESEKLLLSDLYERVEKTAGSEFMERHFGKLREIL
jgi:hypothetical protein